MKEVKTPKKPIIYYILFACAAIILFNLFIVPLLYSRTIEDVDYGTFMSMTEKGEIKTAFDAMYDALKGE